MKFIPRKPQRQARNHIFRNKRAAVWIRMGKGKTGAVLSALNDLNLVEDVYPALVIAGYQVAQSVWTKEIEKWTDFRHLRTSVILGDPNERKLALHKKADLFTINFENVPWLVEYLNGRWPFRTVIIDEAAKLRGFRLRQGTARSRALSKVAHKPLRFIELTGTPAPNGYRNLWGQVYFLDYGARLGNSYTAFFDRWFKTERDEHTVAMLPHAKKEIDEKIKDLCLSIQDDDPPGQPVIIPVAVKLPPEAQAVYRRMEKTFFTEVREHKIDAVNAAVKSGKLLQIANGAVYTDDKGNWAEVHTEKIKALERIVEEANGSPVLTVYTFKSDLARLKKAFPTARVLDKNPKTLDDWNAGKIEHMFIHPGSAAHGISLQDGGHIMAFFSLTWDAELYEQIIERIGPERQRQSGYDRPVFLYLIMAENTLDYGVRDRLVDKISIQDALLQAMAQRDD